MYRIMIPIFFQLKEIMIGYNKNDIREKIKSFEFGIAGAACGFVTRFLCQPIDVIKIRFQLQVEPLSDKDKSGKYRNILQAFRTITKEEGVLALWKGHVPAQILSILFGITQFVTFEELTKHVAYRNPELVQGTFVHFCVGSVSTGIATVVSFPFDVIRTRFVTQGDIKVYTNVTHALVQLYKIEGSRSLFRGLSPTVIQAAPYGGSQFAFYIFFSHLYKTVFINNNGTNNDVTYNPIANLTAGFFAGICAKTIVYPFDVCRKRLQIQGFSDARKNFGEPFVCDGLIDCIRKIYQKESITGFFKGLQPALIKASVVTALHFTLYEHFLNYLFLKKKSVD